MLVLLETIYRLKRANGTSTGMGVVLWENVNLSVLNQNLLFIWQGLKDVTVIFVKFHVHCILLTKIGKILATNTHSVSG